MIAFNGDKRFADMEYTSVTYEPVRRVLTLLVSSDPADNCEMVILRDVVAFDVIHFTMQNVVHYLDIARVTAADLDAFAEIARSEGAAVAMAAHSGPDSFLGAVFVPAGGATIFAVCRSVEKCSSDGQPVYSVTA
ncbi:hypothetical protein JJJ17_01125 [Paracoccus caeni]|uniref:Uncharacterized protein n=1 Tax=Paracoccus caeni TaxID=657651 RepID=A0A934SG21_9RHOB|nr:hypothetical protein [Paracoccus caeni]MBK4214519.1 hypothetical protein [Paracoccus caeni]